MEQTSAKKQGWPLIGNEHIVNYLSSVLKKDKPRGSYIFLGPNNLGKNTLANYFIKNILCEKNNQASDKIPCEECPSCRQMKRLKTSSKHKQEEGEEDGFEVVHGDFHIIKKDSGQKNISIKQIRELTSALSKSSFLNSYKIGIIKEAETLSLEASNALLKILEEPNRKVIIIMVASNLEFIPETIVSRSQVLNFYPVKIDSIYDYLVNYFNTSRTDAINISRLSLGRPALAVKLLEDKDFYKEYLAKAKVFISFFNQDLNSRFAEINRIFGNSSFAGESAKEAGSILEAWRGVVRDLLLLVTNNKDLVQYKALFSELEEVSRRIDLDCLLRINNKLDKGEKQIQSNVNPGLVLEGVACSIN